MAEITAQVPQDGESKKRVKPQKEGCGMNMSVLGIKLEHHEKSRASKVNCINHKVPDQCLSLLKTDEERRRSVQQYQQIKQTKAGATGGFHDRKEKEFFNILKRIERIRNHKLETGQGDTNTQNGGASDTRKATSNIEQQIKQTQKELDQKRNASQGTTKPTTAGSFATSGRLGSSATNGRDEALAIDNDMTDANLNILNFLKQKPMRPQDMKFQRVITAQGAGTFEDIKQDLEEFHRSGKPTIERRAVTRQQRQDITELRQNGKEVGAYTPIFNILERRQTVQPFYGKQSYMSDRRRQQMKAKLEKNKNSIDVNLENQSIKDVNPQVIMREKRQLRSQIKNLEPSQRPDPFKPAKTWYRERTSQRSIPITKDSCRSCVRKGSPFTQYNDWELQKVSANWQYSARVDSHIQDFSRHCPHHSILDGQKPVTDSRFETNAGSTFLAGEIMPSSALHTSMQMRNRQARSFNARTSMSSKISNANIVTEYKDDESSLGTHRDLTLGVKRPLVANLANVPTVKIANYSKRNPETLFYCQGQAPRPSDSEGHGGVFYSTQNHSKIKWSNQITNVVPFERKVESKRDKIKRIEAVTKKSKSQNKSEKRNKLKQMAMENAEMLFNILQEKDQKKKARVARYNSSIPSPQSLNRTQP